MGEGDIQALNAGVPVASGEVRHTGITTIGDVPWGTHFCLFYQDKQDVIDILVPYFKGGLKNNEFCMWVTSEPLRAAEAKAALAAKVENLEMYITNGQLEILDTEWYTSGGAFESDRVLQSWVDRIEAATRRGFAGLRVTGDASWLEKPEWHGFMEYEATVDAIFEQRRILAICTYSLSKCGALQIMDVISNHAFALVKRAGKWEVIQSAERKKVEANLRESEERLRFAQDTANIGTFDWDLATGKNTWTTKLETMYGLPPGGFLGTQPAWEALVHPEDRPRVLQRVSESLESGAPMEDEWRVIWPDGTVHWLAGRWRVVENAGGQPVRVMGVNIDVTNRKQMEEELRKSEERFRLGTKATNDAIWDMDLKTGTVSWNETYSTLYGRPSAGSDSWEWWIDNIHPEDRERTAGYLDIAIASGASSWTSEYRFRRVDGEWAHIYDRAYIARDASGNAWRVIGAMQDLTERKQVETTLRESEERFRRVFQEGPLGLALVGRDYGFLKVNGALCQMVGYSEAELVQMSFTDITHPDDIRADVELAEQLFKREIPFYRIEKRYMKKSGEIIWINLTASIILSPDGEPLHGLAMVEDITERKRVQEESFARQKLESLGTLASGIAHDFNNLLGGVMAQAELALEEYQAGSSPVEELKRIQDGAIRGSEIVRQLMIYAGKESDPVGLVDVSQVARGMVELLKVSVSKHAALVTDFGEDLPAVRGGSGEIQQIVMNLVTNASEALEERDGVIRVSTRLVNVDRAEAVSKGIAEGDYVEIEVSDTGRGMSLETQARVFDPFFTTKSQGHGLGLGVVRGIVRGLDGAIHLSSELGKGSTFQIFLRSTGIMTGATAPLPSAGESSPPQLATILVVEDDDALRVALAQILRRRGFETLDAANGADAINLLRANSIKIDMMLLDMTIPGPSSREVASCAAEVRPGLKVVLTSAYDENLVRTTVSATQACGFVRKPFQIDELVYTLRSALSLRGTTA